MKFVRISTLVVGRENDRRSKNRKRKIEMRDF